MPVSASLTPCADMRHCSYNSVNWTAAWLSVQPSSTDVLMPLDRVACRPLLSAASARHCPAIDCRVAMSTFTGPPPSGPLPVAANARASGARRVRRRPQAWACPRSEEHTSELQSPCNLVCRLLLEKKKNHDAR